MIIPKISVIIPVYNVSKYLRECLDSIINQTLKNIEIIAINDGSTDNSLSILKEYAIKDNRIKILTKSNSGYGHTMNIGLNSAIGEYIGIVEPDDWIKSDMYETLYMIAKNNDLDFIKADFYRFIGTGNSIKLSYNQLCKNKEDYNNIVKPAENLETFRYTMNTWCGIYRRKFIELNNIRHNETPGASFQDNGFYFQTFCLAERAMFINKPFYMNRRDNPNSSVKNKQKVFAFNIEHQYIEKFLKKLNDKRFYKPFLLRKFWNYQFNYKRIDKTLRKEFLDTIKNEFILNNNSDLSLFSELEKKSLTSF